MVLFFNRLKFPNFLKIKLRDLTKVLTFMKEWHFHFIPRYNYSYFLDRCQEFGRKPNVKVFYY